MHLDYTEISIADQNKHHANKLLKISCCKMDYKYIKS